MDENRAQEEPLFEIETHYWAAKTGDDIAKELMSKVEEYDEFLRTSGLLASLRDSYRAFYNLSGGSKFKFQSLSEAGKQGEYSKLRANHYGNLVRHLQTTICQQRPAWQPVSANTDYASQSATILASGLLDYYMKEKQFESKLKESVLSALVLFEGWLHMPWDTSLGEVYAFDEASKQMIMEGDVNLSAHTLIDVIRNHSQKSSNHRWFIIREYKNKYDLASKYPEHASHIVSLSCDNKLGELQFSFSDRSGANEDEIPVYTFYHVKSDALPSGRQVTFLDAETVLFDGELSYKRIPLFKISPEDMLDTCFGFSFTQDLLGVQKAHDILLSTLISNNVTFGMQNIVSKRGSNLSVTQIAEGMNLVEVDGDDIPQALQLTRSAPETYNLLNILERTLETISAVNSVARGNPESNLKSGSALALVQSMAVQFASGLQQSYQMTLEQLGSGLIETLQSYANTKRIAALAGENNQYMLQEWTSEDLTPVNRVTIQTTSALSKTPAGRLELANNLLQNGLIKDAAQYIQVLMSGNLSPMTEDDVKQNMLIRKENESFRKGATSAVIATDNHVEHILKHRAVLDDPSIREVPGIVQVVLAHIEEHMNQMRNIRPELAQILGIPVMPPEQPPMPQGPQSQPGEMLNVENPVTGEAAEIQPAKLPVNPMTGERVKP